MATPPGSGPWSWVPPDWLGGGAVMPEPEMQFPPDDFADLRSVQPELEMPEEYVGAPPQPDVDPFAALRAPSAEQPYMGLPTDLDAAPPVEPEPLPSADAITGVGPIPAAPMVGGLGIPEDMFQAAMAQAPTTTPGVPVLPPEYVSDQEAGLAYAMSSPEQQLNQQLDLETRRSDMQRQRMAEASKADAEEAERDERDWRTSRETARREIEQVDIEAKAEAAREIDINRGWNDASTGTKIAGIFSALAGGLVAHKYGGRNSGLEMIDKLIERDIDAQKFNKLQRTNDLTRRGASARDRMAMAGDDFREETRLRLTAYDRVLGQIASDAQNFDPRGTQAIRYGQAYQDLAARRAQMALDAQKRIADQYKEQLDFAGKELDLQKKQAELAKAQRAAMGGGARAPKPDDVPQGEQALRMLFPGAPKAVWDFVASKGGAATPNEIEKLIGRVKSAADAGKSVSDAEIKGTEAGLETSGPGGSAYAVAFPDGAVITTIGKDGKPVPFDIKDPVERQKARALVESAANITAFVDKLTLLSEKSGGAWESLASDEVQELKSLASAVDFETFKGFDLGAPSEGDKALAADARGGDVTSFKNRPIAGLQTFARSVQQKVNTKLGVLGRVGKPIEFARVKPQTKSSERTVIELVDSWDPAVLRDPSVPVEAQKAEASAALVHADALARKSEPAGIITFARQLQERLDAGLVEPVEAVGAQKSFRTQFKRKFLTGTIGDRFARAKDLGFSPEDLEKIRTEQFGDAEIDALLGFKKAGE